MESTTMEPNDTAVALRKLARYNQHHRRGITTDMQYEGDVLELLLEYGAAMYMKGREDHAQQYPTPTVPGDVPEFSPDWL